MKFNIVFGAIKWLKLFSTLWKGHLVAPHLYTRSSNLLHLIVIFFNFFIVSLVLKIFKYIGGQELVVFTFFGVIWIFGSDRNVYLVFIFFWFFGDIWWKFLNFLMISGIYWPANVSIVWGPTSPSIKFLENYLLRFNIRFFIRIFFFNN